MYNSIEEYIVTKLSERLEFDNTSNNDFIALKSFNDKQKLQINKCGYFVTCVSNNPNYDEYENRQNSFRDGNLDLYFYGVIKTKNDPMNRVTEFKKYQFASQVLRILESLEVEKFQFEVENVTYTINLVLANPRISYSISDNNESEFGINFNAIYERLSIE
jgi:hypothetical protein